MNRGAAHTDASTRRALTAEEAARLRLEGALNARCDNVKPVSWDSQRDIEDYICDYIKLLPILQYDRDQKTEGAAIFSEKTVALAHDEVLEKASEAAWKDALHIARQAVGEAWTDDLARAFGIAWAPLMNEAHRITRSEVDEAHGEILRSMKFCEALTTANAALDAATENLSKLTVTAAAYAAGEETLENLRRIEKTNHNATEGRKVETAWGSAETDPAWLVVIGAALDLFKDKPLLATLDAIERAGRGAMARAIIRETRTEILHTAMDVVVSGKLPKSAVLNETLGPTDALLDVSYSACLVALYMLVEDLDFPEKDAFFETSRIGLNILQSGCALFAIIHDRPFGCTQAPETAVSSAERWRAMLHKHIE